MLVKPSVTELLKIADNRFELIVAISKRARQISTGSIPLTQIKADSSVTLAANEFSEGKVVIC